MSTIIDWLFSNALDIWSNYATILGLFITIFFSWVTYNLGRTANALAQRSLELSINDKTQFDQLDKLRELYEIQSKQLQGITAQLEIANNHYNLAAQVAEGIRLASFFKLKKSLRKIVEAIYYVKSDSFKALTWSEKMPLINELRDMIVNALENKYLTADQGALFAWNEMAHKCDFFSYKIEAIFENPDLDVEQREEICKRLFELFVKSLIEFKVHSFDEAIENAEMPYAMYWQMHDVP